MISVSAPGLTESYIYDGDGNKVSQTVNGVTTNYLVDTNNLTGYAQVIEEIQGSTIQKVYTYGTTRISQDALVGSSYIRSYFGCDGQGSVRFLMDSTGNVTDQYTYSSFGETLFQGGPTSNAFLYDGEQQDGNTGFYNLRARWMNPGVGRFQGMDSFDGEQEDPISLHRYLFGLDNPENKTDPSGNQTLEDEFGKNKLLQDRLPTTFARLEAGVGGPEIGQTLNGTLQDVDKTFNGWSAQEKNNAANDMYSLPQAIRAWDIYPLKAVGFNETSFVIQDKEAYLAGSGAWTRTVAVNKKCYYAGAVNYALWGRMNKLCYGFLKKFGTSGCKFNVKDYSSQNAIQKAVKWKLHYSDNFGEEEREALEFTAYGYSGYSPMSSLPCRPSTDVMTASSFSWGWTPNKY